MSRGGTIRRLVGAAATVGAIGVTYSKALRPRMLHWGTDPAEVGRSLPGDDIVPRPRMDSTRTVLINAPVDRVWPWLVQMGQGRGGLYSYDALENIIGLNIHSADTIIPALQNLSVGDAVSLAPDNALPMTVAQLEPNHALVLRTGMPNRPVEPGSFFRGEIDGSWAFVLEAVSPDKTRLIVRWRMNWAPGLPGDAAVRLLLEPAHFVMERKMMLGIRERAERNSRKTLI